MNNLNNSVTLTLIRGLPGSGKSTLAQRLATQTGAIHLETDMFFVAEDGVYRFAPQNLSVAHQWCQRQTKLHLSQGRSVIVSNTFVRHWEMKAYKTIAKQLNIPLEIRVCQDQFGSIHQIDPQTIEKMKANWQP
ncbi:ATP-binding protein [Vibrio aphrogenes]|uniref:ATP-binding protein n=1 Tax=Vibrio aphrogenes TaxID=1891186 RepID=UPI000B357911|nr:ATP-binding protein [Vibrio aphrogenes]